MEGEKKWKIHNYEFCWSINNFSYPYICSFIDIFDLSPIDFGTTSLSENVRVYLRKHLRTRAQNDRNDYGGFLGRTAGFMRPLRTRENDTWQFYRETHSECIYVSARTFTATMSFVLVSDRASSFWKTELHVDSSMATATRTQGSVSKDVYSYYRKGGYFFCSVSNLHGFFLSEKSMS